MNSVMKANAERRRNECLQGLIVFGVICLVGVGIAFALRPPAPAPTPRPAVEPIHMSQFKQLKDGMTYDECARILGRDGELKASAEVGQPQFRMSVYHWNNEDGSECVLTFANRQMTTKGQTGLRN